jgi:hypothetical protein
MVLNRRSFIAALGLVPLSIARADRAASAVWYVGDTVAKPGKGVVTARRVGNRSTLAKLGAQVRPQSIDITSTSNDNTQFVLWAVFPKQPDKDVFLFADGEYLMSDSYGHDDTGSQASFQLDRATAVRLAKLLGRPLNERAKLDGGLTATFVFPPRIAATSTAPITVRMRVKNAGTTTVGFVIGGRQRGARDNRFSFAISRDGKPLAIKDAPDFGGIMYYKALKPGDEHELTVDLRSWADVTLPGHYQIDATYEGELAKDGVMPATAADRKNLWDIKLAGQGGILVQ